MALGGKRCLVTFRQCVLSFYSTSFHGVCWAYEPAGVTLFSDGSVFPIGTLAALGFPDPVLASFGATGWNCTH